MKPKYRMQCHIVFKTGPEYFIEERFCFIWFRISCLLTRADAEKYLKEITE